MPGATSARSRVGAVAWSLAFMVFGYLTMTGMTVAAFVAAASRYPQLVTGTTGPFLIQSGVGIGVFGGLTLLVRRRALRLGSDELGWAPARVGLPGFLKGFVLALGLAIAAQVGGLVAHSAWRFDGGDFGSYLIRLVVLAALLLPPAFMEELAFRGAAIAGMARGVGRPGAVMITAVLFSLAHRDNAGVTAVAFGNIVLAGIFLGLAFFAPGGLWTATGAHLGWNWALAGLAAPVSGMSFDIPWIDFRPGAPAWLTGGNFGPEGGLLATGALLVGVAVVSRWPRREETS